MPLLCCNPSLLRIQSATSHLSLSLPGTCSWMKSPPGHTLKTPKPLGCGEHRENPQIKPSVHNLTCAKGSFHPEQLLPPPAVAVPIGAQAQLPGLWRLHQIPTSSRASSRAGELAGEPEYLALCLGPALVSRIRVLATNLSPRNPEGAVPAPADPGPGANPSCLPPQPLTASPPRLSGDFGRTERETIKF